MAFTAHPTYLDFETANQPYATRLSTLLGVVTADNALFPKFLNTLSMMEHMGARRIMLTQGAGALNQETLKHMAEETRHAFFYKRQAERFAKRSMDYTASDTIAPSFARMYFKRLESHIAQTVKDDADPLTTAYLYMSMIIEFRAVWGFELLQTSLDAAGRKLSLKSLLAEEQGHLEDMEARLTALDGDSPIRVKAFLEKENALFVRLLTAFEAAVLPEQAAA